MEALHANALEYLRSLEKWFSQGKMFLSRSSAGRNKTTETTETPQWELSYVRTGLDAERIAANLDKLGNVWHLPFPGCSQNKSTIVVELGLETCCICLSWPFALL